MIDVLQEPGWGGGVPEACSSAECGEQVGWDLKGMLGGFSYSFS